MFKGDIGLDDFSRLFEGRLEAEDVNWLHELVNTFPNESFEALVRTNGCLILLYIPLRRIAIKFMEPDDIDNYICNRKIEKSLNCVVCETEVDDYATIDSISFQIKYNIHNSGYNVNCAEGSIAPNYTDIDLAVLDLINLYVANEH